MREIEIDFDDVGFFEVMVAELEKEYGRSVVRIAKLQRTSYFSFDISVIFSDFCLLEAEVNVMSDDPFSLEPVVTIRGEYH
jgi:hypothetical protein